jgi:hypothetical protein
VDGDVSQDRLGAPPARKAGGRPMLKMGSISSPAENGMRATLERIAALVEL